MENARIVLSLDCRLEWCGPAVWDAFWVHSWAHTGTADKSNGQARGVGLRPGGLIAFVRPRLGSGKCQGRVYLAAGFNAFS